MDRGLPTVRCRIAPKISQERLKEPARRFPPFQDKHCEVVLAVEASGARAYRRSLVSRYSCQ